MLHMIEPHSLTKTGVPLKITNMSMTLNERSSTATVTLDDRTDMTRKEITSMWFYDDMEPGAGTVWRAQSLTEAHDTKTPSLKLEHVINTLKDTIIFSEVTPVTITGDAKATKASAKDTIKYLLKKQETQDWKLGTFDVDDVQQGFNFEGESIYDAIVSVCNALEDCWWTLNTKSYPFKLNIRKMSDDIGTMLRAGRNITALKVTTDKTGMYTRFWPVGKDDLHLTDNKSGYTVDYIRSKNADTYGVIDKTETDSNITTVADLAAFARARLRKHSKPVTTIDVTGLELSRATGQPVDQINLGQMCQVVIGETGKTYKARIIEKTYSDKVNSPEVVKITLSNKQDDVASIVAYTAKKQSKSTRTQARQSKQTREILYNTVKGVKVTGPDANNKYTLQYQLVKDVGWTDAGTFSRAVASWDVSATDGTIKVTAKPQNQSKEIDVRGSDPSVSGFTYTSKIQYSKDGLKTTDSRKVWLDTGKSISINVRETYNNGWDAAEALVEDPAYSDSSSFVVKVPKKLIKTGGVIERTQVSKHFSLGIDTPSPTGYAKVRFLGVQVAKISLTTYWTGGWDDAAGLVETPGAGNSTSFVVKVPAIVTTTGGVIDRIQVSKTFSMSIDTPSAAGYAKVNLSGTQVARISLTTFWTGGWDNAEGMVVMPATVSSNEDEFTVKVPQKTTTTGGVVDRSQVSKTFTLSVDGSYAYVKLSNKNVARVPQYYNNSGTLYYDDYDFISGQFVYYYHQTVSQQGQAIVTSGSRLVRWHT